MKSKLGLFELFRVAASIGISILAVLAIILLVSKEPGKALYSFALGPLASFSRFGNVLEMTIPLTFAGLAVCVMFKASQFNMISEGAFYMGAVTAALAAIYLPLPPVVLPAAAILSGMAVGGALGALPAALKVKTNSSILVVSLMMNYMLALLGRYISANVMRDPKSGSGSSYAFQRIAKLPVIAPGTRIHLGMAFMLLAVAAVAVLMSRTKLGYAVRMVGLNEKFAAYSGINVNMAIMLSQIIGGALAGIGGTVEMLGMYSRFSWVGTPGDGWDAVIISILAGGNPVLVPLAALFLSYIRIGADAMAMSSDVPAEIVTIVQAVMILLLVSQRFLSSVRERIARKETLASQAAGGAKE
jgi:simple sugar transport system permease protein